MEKIIHNTFTLLKKISFLLLIAGFCTLGVSFDSHDPAAPTVQVVKCYPNPATSFINFEFPKNIDKTNTLLVYSFVGKKMTELSVSNSKMVVTLTDYYRGVYVFQLRDKGGNIIESGKFSVVK